MVTKAKGKGMIAAPAPAAKQQRQGMRQQKRINQKFYGNLAPKQRQAVQQQEGFDLNLGNTAGGQLGQIGQAYSQPVDWNSIPKAPGTEGADQWRQQFIDSTYGDFTKRMDPQFAKQSEDFEQQMANRGIPPGSQLYNQQKQQLDQSQNDARQSALAQAQSQGLENAQGFFNMGTQAHQGGISDTLMQRNQPLNDYNSIMAARSQMPTQNLGYQQQMQLQNDAQADQWRQLQAQMAHKGGGGGGGGGSDYGGFGSQEGLWAAQDARSRANQMWQWQNDPRYAQSSGPSAGMQLGGGLLGAVTGGLGQALGKGIYGLF